MAFYNKIKWALGISLVFFLIVATNLIDRNNFKRVKDSVVTIYEDRLIAKDIVFELAILVQEKEMANAFSDFDFLENQNKVVNKKIDELILKFLDTRLTVDEKRTLDDLELNLNKLKAYEINRLEQKISHQDLVEKQLMKVKDNLYDLSKIQLEEGRRQVFISKEAINSVEVFTQIEIYVLIFLAILIQIIVIYKPKDDNLFSSKD